MAKKDRFAVLGTSEANSLKDDSHLKESAGIDKKAKKNQMVYGISVELASAIEDAGESLSGFAKRAMMKVAREEGII